VSNRVTRIRNVVFMGASLYVPAVNVNQAKVAHLTAHLTPHSFTSQQRACLPGPGGVHSGTHGSTRVSLTTVCARAGGRHGRATQQLRAGGGCREGDDRSITVRVGWHARHCQHGGRDPQHHQGAWSCHLPRLPCAEEPTNEPTRSAVYGFDRGTARVATSLHTTWALGVTVQKTNLGEALESPWSRRERLTGMRRTRGACGCAARARPAQREFCSLTTRAHTREAAGDRSVRQAVSARQAHGGGGRAPPHQVTPRARRVSWRGNRRHDAWPCKPTARMQIASGQVRWPHTPCSREACYGS
jgi:hypothetical protein